MQTHPIGKVWGGNYIFKGRQSAEVLEAVRDFTENYPDEKAAVIVTAEHAALLNMWIVFVFYDGPEPPKGVFDKFTALNPRDKTKTWDSYYDLVSGFHMRSGWVGLGKANENSSNIMISLS